MKEEGTRISLFLINVNALCNVKSDSSKFRISNMPPRLFLSIYPDSIDLMSLRICNRN